MDYTEKIERYIEGLMDEQELESFRKEMAENPELSVLVADALRIQKTGEELFSEDRDTDPADLSAGIEKKAAEDIESYSQKVLTQQEIEENLRLRSTLENARRRYGSEGIDRPAGIRLRRLWYAAAAVVVLAVAIPLLLNTLKSKLSPDTIYISFYMAFEDSENLVELTRTDNKLIHAIEVYESGNYTEATMLFEPFLTSGPFRETAHFYTGLCSMGTSQFHVAIDYLVEVLVTDNAELVRSARWYLGLSYLKVNDTESALIEFKILSESDAEISKKAIKVLKKIQKL